MPSRGQAPAGLASWRQPDLAAAVVLLAVGVIGAFMSVGYGLTDERGVSGPGLMPLLASGSLAAMALGLGARAVAGDRREPEGPGAPPPVAESPETGVPADQVAAPAADSVDRRDTSGALGGDRRIPFATPVLVAIMAVTVVVAPHVGLLASSAAMIFVILAVVERQGIAISFVIAAVTVLACWLLLDLALGLPLSWGSVR